MSGTAGPPTAVLGLGLDDSGLWHPRALQNSRSMVQTYLPSSSVHPPSTAGGGNRGTKTPLRLPSLVASAKGPHRRSSSMARLRRSVALYMCVHGPLSHNMSMHRALRGQRPPGSEPLSLSEPSLLIPNDNELFEVASTNRRRSVLQKQPPPPPSLSKSSAQLSCKTRCHSGTGQSHQLQVQSCGGPAYIHFSQAIQLSSKPRPVRRHSHNPALSAHIGDLRPLTTQGQDEPLSVIGKPCLPSCSQRPAVAAAAVAAAAVAGPARPQLHVFLPMETEREEVDRESVDEGFMDELDTKLTSLTLQQGAPNAVSHHRLTKTD